ncbi:sugar ABC transporter substrate-binding protein [Selenomonas sputigena]|uniref:Sugar ABC transporter substrate-binding protein n=1 Tax=Selenomonas sputigena TaxID=69823 RepID=A0ABV3XA58_9FIRM
MKMREKWSFLLLAVVFAVSTLLSGCGSSDKDGSAGSDGKGAIKLGFVCMNLGNPWFVSVKKGFEDACKEEGVEALTIDSQYKVDKQVNDMESLVSAGYSGIMISPIDQNATKSIVDKAKAEKIVVSCVAQSQDNVNMRYIVDEYSYGEAIGKQAAEWINKTLGSKDKVKVAIISQDNVDSVIPRGNGVEETIKKMCPNVEIVSRQAGDTPELGMKIIESVLQQHPDLNVVVATNDSGGLGGYQAMVGANISGDDRAVFSGDATSECLAAMKKPNSIYRGTVDLFPYKAGYESAKMLIKYIREGIPATQETIVFDPVPVPAEDLLSGKYVPKG